MMFETNTKFAVVALANTQPAFDGRVLVNPRFAFSAVPPFELDVTWQKWLGSIADDRIRESDFFLLAREPAKNPTLLDGQNDVVLSDVESILMTLYLLGIPTCSSGHEFTGTIGPSGVDIRQVKTLIGYRKSCRTAPHHWTASDVETSVSLGLTVSRIGADTERFRQLRRGMKAYFSALEATDPRDRLHQAVRSLEALTLPSKHQHGKKWFEHRYNSLIQSTPSDGFLGELYQLRSYVEHLEDSQAEHLKDGQFAQKVTDKDEFARFFEQREAQAVDLARSVYLRIISDTDALNYFEEDADIPQFWAAVEHRDVRPCEWICPISNPEDMLHETE